MKRRKFWNRRSSSSKPIHGVAIAGVLFIGLLFFSAKPIHLDDTFFIEAARKIRSDPLHPYRSVINWDGAPESLWATSMHPPLHSYLLAVAFVLVGSDEVTLHALWAAMAAACAFLMYLLARRFCDHPSLATLLAVLNPGFFVSATTLMADISLLFFWLLAVHTAVFAAEKDRRGMLWFSAVSASAAAMTKYFGIAVVPLLVVWWIVLFRRTRSGTEPPQRWRSTLGSVGMLCIPIAVLIAWGIYAMLQPECGFFHPLAAAKFSTSEKSLSVVFQGARTALSFLGGSLLWPLCMLPIFRNLSGRLKACLVTLALFAVISEWFSVTGIGHGQLESARLATSGVMALAGAAALTFAAAGCCARRDAESLLLGLWCFGTIGFCAFINWTVNVRVLLPAVFPISVLVIRWVESLGTCNRWLFWTKVSLCPTLATSLIVATADYDFAIAAKRFAQTTARKLISSGEQVTFVGHWGFQYYMEREGAQPLDYVGETTVANNRYYLLKPGEIIIYPDNNSGTEPMMANIVFIFREEFSSRFGVHTMNKNANAGFYSNVFGNVAYNLAFDRPVDAFSVYRVVDPP